MSLFMQVLDTYGRLPLAPPNFPRCGPWGSVPNNQSHSLQSQNTLDLPLPDQGQGQRDRERSGVELKNDLFKNDTRQRSENSTSMGLASSWVVPLLVVLSLGVVILSVVVVAMLSLLRSRSAEMDKRLSVRKSGSADRDTTQSSVSSHCTETLPLLSTHTDA